MRGCSIQMEYINKKKCIEEGRKENYSLSSGCSACERHSPPGGRRVSDTINTQRITRDYCEHMSANWIYVHSRIVNEFIETYNLPRLSMKKENLNRPITSKEIDPKREKPKT